MTAYYSDNDPFVCQWLRNLIAAGKITPGDVDERPIQEVSPDDVRGYDRCHFFAGIAGWDLALTLAGWDGPCWTGSCPCQPFSQAGKRQGEADARHLWPAFHRLISECRPGTVFGEQVGGPAGYEWLAGVRLDLEADRYAVGAADLPAASVGAPHIRQRLWWVAHADGRKQGQLGIQAMGSRADDRLRSTVRARKVPERMVLANGTGRHAGLGAAEGARHGSAAEPAGSGLADAERNGSRAGTEDCRWEAGRRYQGNAGGLGDAPVGGVGAHEGQSGAGGEPQEQAGGSGARLGNAVGPRPQERSGAWAPGADGANPWEAAVATGGFWSDCYVKECADGKARRIGTGVQPLAYGLRPDLGSDRPGEDSPFRVIRDPKTGRSIGQAPWRVGMLRGYGNAIVPACAAMFVRAFMECRP